jgi:iron complex transport system substrate-binding protein
MRVVSLLGSSTEIICALGCESFLVGRSHECDFPATVRRLPALTEPRLDVRLPSAAIDRRLKDLVREALSIYRVDAEALRDLAPDVVVTQTQCEVCAVSESDVAGALETWIDGRPRIVSLQGTDLEGVWQDFRRIASALAVTPRGDALIAALRDRIQAIAARAAALPSPGVACIEWIAPPMASGNWMPELVALAGGRNLFGAAGRHSPRLDWEEVVAADPEVIVILPCGFDLERTRAEMPALAQRPEWPRLRAVRSGRVALADGNAYFNRPGPRLVESLEILAEILHPQRFDFGHRGRAWRPL